MATLEIRTTEDIEDAILRSIPQRERENRENNWVSTLGDICERRLVYWRIMGDMALDPSAGLLGIFETGTVLAPIIIERILNPFGRMQAPSWEILGRETKPHDPLFTKLAISGRVDGIRHVSNVKGRLRPYNVVELKSMGGSMFERLKTRADLGKWHWAAKYEDQVQLYMLGYNMVEHPAWLVVFNKANLWRMKIFEIPFDESRTDRLLARAERINVHVAARTLPRTIDRPDICANCPFLGHCAPKLKATPDDPPKIIKPEDDPDLAAMLDRYSRLEGPKKEAERISRKLADRLVKGQTIVCGDVVVRWKPHGKTWARIISRVGGEANHDT